MSTNKPKRKIDLSGRPPEAQIADLSYGREQLLEQIKQVEDAPRPYAFVYDDIVKLIEAGAARVASGVASLAKPQPSIADVLYTLDPPQLPGHRDQYPPGPFALMCAVAPEHVRAWLENELLKAYDHLPKALADEEREARLKTLRAQLATAEQELTDLWWGYEEVGILVPPPTVSAAVFLGLEP